jgi:hypothetical protein
VKHSDTRTGFSKCFVFSCQHHSVLCETQWH